VSWTFFSKRGTSPKTMKQISSMMAGVVIEVLVKAGDTVSDGMDVAILESMKMQLPVQSELSGKVKEVKVSIGDFVNEGDPLLLLE
jgi:acetyl-CoA carboxylase biotin carboxyl carrier protein